MSPISLVRFSGVVLALVFAASAAQALDPADKCVTLKMKESGKYTFCRMKAEAKGVLKSLPPDFSKCDTKLSSKWATIEANAAGACPTNGDLEGIRRIATADTGLLAGTVAAKARFQNNGDGTTTDLTTGLTWENKSYLDGSIHDVAGSYMWSDTFAIHIATLNTDNFGGHDDWRVPTVTEMLSLLNYSSTQDVKGYSEFDQNCVTGCDVLDCSCAFSQSWNGSNWWTSVTNPDDPSEAYVVGDHPIEMDPDNDKIFFSPVIAVRGGRTVAE